MQTAQPVVDLGGVCDGVHVDHRGSVTPWRSAAATDETRARKPHVDQIDVCDRERDVAGEHYSPVEEAVKKIDQGDVFLPNRRGGRRDAVRARALRPSRVRRG